MSRLLIGGLGFGLWLLATLVFRVAGHEFFLIDNTILMIGLWVATAFSLFLTAEFIFRWQRIPLQRRYEAAILLVVPGMLGDAFTTQFFNQILPNMNSAADGPFAAWLLWAYAIVLVTGLWSVWRN